MSTAQQDSEIVPCTTCGTLDNITEFYPIKSGRFVRCNTCNLYFASPRYTKILNSFKENTTSDTLWEAKNLNLIGRIREFNWILKKLHKLKPPGGKILDIGGYEGLFLYEARKFGWECFGVEPHIGGAKHAREKLKLDVRQCLLEQAGFEDSSFDVITMNATLEHVPNPSDIMKDLRRLIRNDGYILINVPVIPFYLNLIKAKWRMFIPGHMYFFSDSSLEALMKKHDFKIIYKCFVPKSVDLETIFERLSSDNHPMNIGKTGKWLYRNLKNSSLSSLRILLQLYDIKLYIAKPVRSKSI